MTHAEQHVEARVEPRAGLPDDFRCIDGVRAIAALMIVVYHAAFFASLRVSATSPAVMNTTGGAFLARLNSGVWVFFVVSGFLLYRPFAAAHQGDRGGVRVGAYAVRRIARIYPAYWLVLAFFTFVIPRAVITGVDEFFSHSTLTFTYLHFRTNPFLIGLPPAWSLVVEVSFYAFLPLYAWLMGKLVRGGVPLRVELLGIASLLCIGAGAWCAIAAGYEPPWIDVLPKYIASFALGMLLAVLMTTGGASTIKAALHWGGSRAWLCWASAAIVFVGMRSLIGARLDAHGAFEFIGLNLLQTVFGFLIVLPAVFGTGEQSVIRAFLRHRVVAFLGIVSYGIYLWHWFLLKVVLDDWLHQREGHAHWVALLAATVPLVIAAATISWYALERPILRAARRTTRETVRA
ncbi:MAG TPA: acyltransferase [Acidimicrobiia bacterium]|nr:acyltransferase [Acidimicrobiia bacterium]